jgi:hypothetical protein
MKPMPNGAPPTARANAGYARCWFAGIWTVTLIAGLGASAGELADFETSLFSGAGNCAFCHDPWNASRTGQPGEAAVLATDWRATMMAHSFKDPLWRAVMEAEVKAQPQLKSFIENKCQTCHAPLARTQAAAEGTNQLAYADAQRSPLAGEGVGCTLCHQIQPGNLGTQGSFTGHYQITTNRQIFGPYSNVLTMPMRRHVAYTTEFGAHIQDSALCATCHTLFTPILDASGKVAGEFPEQTPYLEWINSDFAREGKHCQDCHMTRLDAPVKISSRPPWLDPREPFWKHQIVGGNAFMLQLLADNSKRIEANADVRQLEFMAAQTRSLLQSAAALQVAGKRAGQTIEFEVTVENLTGHKFPTGHPYRRAWLHVRVTDTKKRTHFESGAVDQSGAIQGAAPGFAPHFDLITRPEEVQIYQSVMMDTEGKPTWTLLRGAAYHKDNRLPPRGFSRATTNTVHIEVAGEAANDPNFNAAANGRDTVTYRFEVPPSKTKLTIEVELLYQSVPPETVAYLLNSGDPEARAFAKMYRRQNHRPERVQRQQLEL